MRVAAIYARFYRAFNYDYLRKAHEGFDPDPWDKMEGEDYPYIRIPMDPEMTCVVGANESGKSQLLDIVEQSLMARNLDEADFCRYSKFVTVERELRVPHVGVELTGVTDEEAAQLTDAGITTKAGKTVRIFRETKHGAIAWVEGSDSRFEIDSAEALRPILPTPFRIDPRKPLPDKLPFAHLLKEADDIEVDVPPRRALYAVTRVLMKMPGLLGKTLDEKEAKSLAGALTPAAFTDPTSEEERAGWDLAADLLVVVGHVNEDPLNRLIGALEQEDEGFVKALGGAIDDAIEKALDLGKWWSQDPNFRLHIDVRDHDLVFTISDRTEKEYSFDERSSGLKYFLSYLVQYLTHISDPARTGDEILLMDEPDAYLSNTGQQDLLRLFLDFTARDDSGGSSQVMFVTHSPFLIDKNRPDRVRVLDKGRDDQGTRLVKDQSRNHFEPLRSAFGGFVAETVFIGNCNIIMEGVSDQIYLATISTHLLRQNAPETERLDLNNVTLVPAGSASHIPYMTYLARGRDSNQPAVVVLLDGDTAGKDARKALAKKVGGVKTLNLDKHLLVIDGTMLPEVTSVREGGPQDIEDLVDPTVAAAACDRYAREFEIEPPRLTPSDIAEAAKSKGVYSATAACLKSAGSELRLDKVPFARHVVDALFTPADQEPLADGITTTLGNFRMLLTRLTVMQRAASRERSTAQIVRSTRNAVQNFVRDHPDSCTRAQLRLLFEEIEAALDDSKESEAIRHELRLFETDHPLNVELNRQIGDYRSVRTRLEALHLKPTLDSQEEVPTAQSSSDAQPTDPADEHED